MRPPVTAPVAAPGNGSEDKAHVTVGDYLEKIFQIPIWMSPIGHRARAQVVKTLLGPTAAPRGTVVARAESDADPEERGKVDPQFVANPGRGAFQTLVAKAAEQARTTRAARKAMFFIDWNPFEKMRHPHSSLRRPPP